MSFHLYQVQVQIQILLFLMREDKFRKLKTNVTKIHGDYTSSLKPKIIVKLSLLYERLERTTLTQISIQQ